MSIGIPKAQQDRLKSKMVELVRNLVIDDLFLAFFRRGGIFTSNTQEEIEVEKTTDAQNSKLLRELLCSSKSFAYVRLIEALVETKQRPLANSLDKKETEAYEERRERILKIDEVDARQQKIDSVFLKDKTIVDEVDNGESVMEVNVTSLTEQERINQLIAGVYPITNTEGNRRAIIINNRVFMGMEERNGTEFDEQNIKSLFEKLHFEVTVHKNRYDQEIKSDFKTLIEDPKLSSCEILVVFILSHGCRGAVYGGNDKMVYVQDILDSFSPENCPALIDRPKLFFIQACQIDSKKHGAAPPEMCEMRPPPDTLLAFSTCEGYKSWRTADRGTWFIRAVVSIFAKNAHNNDVLSLLKQVCRIVLMMKSSENDLQLPETRTSRFKNCFLMP